MTTYVFIICRISLYTESKNSEGSMDDAGCKSGWQRAAAAAGGARAVAGDRERSRRDRQDAFERHLARGTQTDAGDLLPHRRGAAYAAKRGAGGDRGGVGKKHMSPAANAASSAQRNAQAAGMKKTGERSALLFFDLSVSAAPVLTVLLGNTAGRGLRGADFRAWSARS